MAYVISTLLNSVQLLSFLWFFDGFFVRKYQGIRFWVIALMWDAAVCFLLNIEASVLSPVKVISVIASILLLSVLLYVGDLAFKVFLCIIQPPCLCAGICCDGDLWYTERNVG